MDNEKVKLQWLTTLANCSLPRHEEPQELLRRCSKQASADETRKNVIRDKPNKRGSCKKSQNGTSFQSNIHSRNPLILQLLCRFQWLSWIKYCFSNPFCQQTSQFSAWNARRRQVFQTRSNGLNFTLRGGEIRDVTLTILLKLKIFRILGSTGQYMEVLGGTFWY